MPVLENHPSSGFAFTKKLSWLWPALVAAACGYHLLSPFSFELAARFSQAVFVTVSEIWWAVLLSILAVGFFSRLPQEMVLMYFNNHTRLGGVVRATLAGTLCDLGSRGVFLLGMKIYERGASLGQVMAFLVAGPFNSFTASMILFSLLGGALTFGFFILSFAIAVITGLIFDELVKRRILPANSTHWQPARPVAGAPFRLGGPRSRQDVVVFVRESFKESHGILQWVFLGVLISAALRTFVATEAIAHFFGNSIEGSLATLAAAAGFEFFTEGALPLAGDLVTVAKAPGNAFIFLMAGLATDWRELWALRQITRSWKTALFFPLITVPQILLVGILINKGYFAVLF